MAEKYPEQKDTPFLWFFLLSIALNVGAAFSGYYWSFPERTSEPDIQLTAIDVNDVPSLGQPGAGTAQPTPPPLDQQPEFEVPEQYFGKLSALRRRSPFGPKINA